MFKSWMTSLPGVALVALGIFGLKWAGLDPVTGMAIITAGLGLLASKQFNVTGGSVPQASPPGVAILSDALGVIDAVDALKKQGSITLSEAVAKTNAQDVIAAPPMKPADVNLCK